MSDTKLLVGVDEAGYGPNLGPLVVSAVALEVPRETPGNVLWDRLAPAVSRYPANPTDALVVDDSKKVFTSRRGIELLERTALAWIGLSGSIPCSLRGLWTAHCLTPPHDIDENPWFADRDLSLPQSVSVDLLDRTRSRLASALEQAGFEPAEVVCQIIMPRRFNELLVREHSKGVALFEVNARLLRHIWDRSPAGEIEVTLDKHGGRNFYRALLQQEFHETVVLAGREGSRGSHYLVQSGGRSLRASFIPEADGGHMLVATASMVAKYLRELWMELFNSFWTTRLPGLRPTAGYPVDAQRFWREIEPLANRLGIARDLVWRNR